MRVFSKRIHQPLSLIALCAIPLILAGCGGGGGSTSTTTTRVYRGTFTYGFEAMSLRPCGTDQPLLLTGKIEPIFDYIREQNGGEYPGPGYYNFAVQVRGRKVPNYNEVNVSEVVQVGPEEDTNACP